MENDDDSSSFYYQIVGKNSNTNEDLARLLVFMAAVLVLLGTVFWTLIG